MSNKSIALELPRSLASDKNQEPHIKENEDDVDIFNTAERFKKAAYHQAKKRKPAQNFLNAAVTPHVLLQNTKWKLWSNAMVVKSIELPEEGEALAQVSNLSIVESMEEVKLTEFDNSKLAAVFDQRLKKAGVLTGVIKVQTADKDKLKEDLKNMQAEISDEFESIQTYFIRSQLKVFNLEELYENLKSQNYIISVELEIISGSYNKY